ncbi:MAG: hypothetical protein V6Z86_03905 [Hyphomicrobiales bacterium]
MQTASYARLCNRLPGKRFIHHETVSMADYGRRKGKEAVVDRMLRWLPHYIGRYGDFTDETCRYWTMCRFLQNELGLSLADINRIGREQAERLKIAVQNVA